MDLMDNNDPNVINDELIRVCIQVRGGRGCDERGPLHVATPLRATCVDYRTATNARVCDAIHPLRPVWLSWVSPGDGLQLEGSAENTEDKRRQTDFREVVNLSFSFRCLQVCGP
jgi:hypothetical protein